MLGVTKNHWGNVLFPTYQELSQPKDVTRERASLLTS